MNIKKKLIKALDVLVNSVNNESELNEIIDKAYIYGSLCWENHVGIYRQDFWENLIAEKILENNDFTKIVNNQPINQNLHIASELYKSGGHTQLLKNLLKMKTIVGDVLVTRYCNLDGIILPNDDYKIYNNSYTLDEILNIASNYKNIYLHIHPNDILTAAAIRILKKISNKNVIFINHADHCFSFGFGAADAVAEVSSFGYFLSKKFRNLCDKSFFMGIPIEYDLIEEIQLNQVNNKINFVSGGSAYKYIPFGNYSFSKTLSLILEKIPESYITLIGPDLNTDPNFKYLKTKYNDRFNVCKILPTNEYLKLIQDAHIYLDSFPLTGGTAFFETRTKNKIVTGILNNASGYTPYDIVKFKSPEELVCQLKELVNNSDSSIIQNNNNLDVLLDCYNCHSLTEIEYRLSNCINNIKFDKNMIESESFDLEFYNNRWVALSTINYKMVKTDIIKIYNNNYVDSCFLTCFFGKVKIALVILKKILRSIFVF